MVRVHAEGEKWLGRAAMAFCRAQPLDHHPGAFVGDIESPLDDLDAHSPAGGKEEVDRLEPFVERNVAGLEDGAYSDRELAPANAAAVKTGANAVAAIAGNFLGGSDRPTVAAYDTIGPAERLELPPRRVLVAKVFRVEIQQVAPLAVQPTFRRRLIHPRSPACVK